MRQSIIQQVHIMLLLLLLLFYNSSFLFFSSKAIRQEYSVQLKHQVCWPFSPLSLTMLLLPDTNFIECSLQAKPFQAASMLWRMPIISQTSLWINLLLLALLTTVRRKRKNDRYIWFFLLLPFFALLCSSCWWVQHCAAQLSLLCARFFC
jgi:hypothetical protein